MNFLLTNYGIAWFTANPGGEPALSEFRVGDGVNYVPDSATDLDLRGTLLFSGAPSAPQLTSSGELNYLVFMDSSVGDFNWGEIGLYHNGNLFALGTSSTLIPKRHTTGDQTGNKTTVSASIHPGSAFVVAELANSSNELNVQSYNSLDQLPPAQSAYPNIFLVPNPGNHARSSLAFASGGVWNVTGYERSLYQLDLVSATANILRLPVDIDMPPEAGGLLVSIFSGPAAGLIRVISDWDPVTKNITLSSPLQWTPEPGDTILISRYSKLADQSVYKLLDNLSPTLEASDLNQLEDLTAFFSPLLRRDGSSSMLANLNIGSNRVINVAAPLLPGDAANKTYVDSQIASGGAGLTGFVKADGSVPMTANFSAGSFKVTNLAQATSGTDATNLTQVNSVVSTALVPYFKLDGTRPLTGNIDSANYRIRNLGAPVDPQDVANLNTVNNASAAVLAQVMRLDGTQPMTGALNVGAQRVRNMANATQPTDAATLYDVTTRVATSLSRSGATPMQGLLDMGSFRITNVADPTQPQDAVTLARMTSEIATAANSLVKRDGSTGMQANLDLAGNKIIGLADPINSTEAATKGYVDAEVASFDTSSLVRRDGTTAMLGTLNLGTFRIINVANPINPQDAATLDSVQAEIAAGRAANVLRDGTQAMQANLNMGTNRIVSVVNPVDAQDAATKNYVDTATSGFLPRNGSAPMTGALAMGSFAITGLPATVTNAGDAVSKAALDSRVTSFSATALLRNGTQAMQANLNMATFKIVNAGNPTADQDVATKKYVDDTVIGIDSTGFLLRDGSRSLTGNLNTAGNVVTGLPITLGYVGLNTSDAISIAHTDLRIAAYAFPLDGSAAFTSDFNMGNNRITSVSDPIGVQDAATKNYVDSVESLDVRLDGTRVMSGNFNAGGFRVTNVAPPTLDTDAVSRGAMNDAVIAALTPVILRDGSRSMLGNLSMGGTFKVTDVAAPTANTDAANKLYVDTLKSLVVLRDGTQAMSSSLNLNANQIVGLAEPTVATDAATKGYVDAAIDTVDTSAFLPRDGSQWMTGNLNMGIRRIINLAAPVDPDDAVTLTHLNTAVNAFLPRDGSSAMLGSFNAGGFVVSGLAAPVATSDAATKAYVDGSISTERNSVVLRNGTQAMLADLSLGTFKVVDVGAPTVATDVATKGYVDTEVSSRAPSANPVFTGSIQFNGSERATEVALVDGTVDCSLGNYFSISVSAPITFAFTNVPTGAYLALLIVDHVSGTLTFPSNVTWPGGVLPTLNTGRVHLFNMYTNDGGTNWHASPSSNHTT